MPHPWIAERMSRFDSSGIRKVFDLAAKLKDPINLSIGQPDFDVPAPVQEALVNAVHHRKNSYSPTQGAAELREAIQARVDAELGHSDRKVFITSGTSGGLTLALMALVNPGDEVVIFDPYFVMYPALINVLGGKPLPEPASRWLPYVDEPRHLLTAVMVSMIAISSLAILISMTARWQATRITKRMQVSVRRKVFEHAVRLPLHRVYELKSGGAASMLREDAGGVAELVFALLYNPFRAIIQLLGSLIILAVTDWRLLLGSLVLIPVVWVTHKTWISRIRPLFSDIRATRQLTDSHATETFGGMRVVRSFSRQRSEAAQFSRNNHLLARQEILAWWWSRAIDIAWALFIPTASALLLWYGGNRILDDAARVAAGTLAPGAALTIGDLVMFLAYLGWLLGPLETLASSATQFQNSLAGLDRVLNVLAEPREMPSPPGARVLPSDTPAGRIVLRNVGYTYPRNSRPVLADINLDAAPGEMIALVGPLLSAPGPDR